MDFGEWTSVDGCLWTDGENPNVEIGCQKWTSELDVKTRQMELDVKTKLTTITTLTTL